MKALSIRAPWAWLIVHGPKRIENRTWRPRFRGDFLVHASSNTSRRDYEEAVERARREMPSLTLPPFEALQRGGIVGHARLIDVIPPCDDERRCLHPWHSSGHFGLVLEGVRPARFRPARGALSFFQPKFD